MKKRRVPLLVLLLGIAAALGVIGSIASWIFQDAGASRKRSSAPSAESAEDAEPGESPIDVPGDGDDSWTNYVPGYNLAEELGSAAGEAWGNLWG